MENSMNKNYFFLFDLDATITKKEILPEISKEIGIYDEMSKLTEKTMAGNIPFYDSFLQRVELLKNIPVTTIQEIVKNIPLNEKIVSFLTENNERCKIVTGNIDVWISKLMDKIKVNYHCSKAEIEDNRLKKLTYVMDKSLFVKGLDYKYVAIGDGYNDIDMILNADIGIAFGGVRKPPTSVLSVATHAIYEEEKLCEFLKRLL